MENKIREILNSALKKMNLKFKKIDIDIESQHSDYSTNIALICAKEVKTSPIDLANKIISNIDSSMVSDVFVKGPGFININIKPLFLMEEVNSILNAGDDFGKLNQNKYINVEYVSANPTGYLHIGHARGAAFGSTLVNILRHAGNKVDSEYYINDAGSQIDNFGQSLLIRYKQEFDKTIIFPDNADYYRGQELVFLAQDYAKKYGDKFLFSKYEDNNVQKIFKDEGKDIMLNKIKHSLKEFRVEIDIYSSEKEIYDSGKIDLTLKKLPGTYKKDGALWLDTSKHGDDKDRVLIKKTGEYSYLMPDIAYHLDKVNRGYDKLINIWGADHFGYIKRMEVALEKLGYKNKLDVITIQLVKLIKDNVELKMSKRKGTSYWLNDLMSMTNVDVSRYYLIMKSENTHIDFNIDEANKKSNENFSYYIQYAYARAAQILIKQKNKINFEKNIVNLNSECELKLIKHLINFKKIIETIANTYKVHLLPRYLLSAAKLFHSFYNSVKVINDKYEDERIMLVSAFKQVLKIGLNLINITPLERM